MSEQSEQELAPEEKRGRGRPSLYKPEYCEQVEALGKLGLSWEQISAEIDVPRSTMDSWGKAHPEFSAALTRAKELEQAWWENTGQSALFADKFQAAVWSKSMSSRFREKYTDKVQQELTGKDGGPLQISKVEIEVIG